MEKKDITVYGADWCGDTVRAKRVLDDLGVEYTFIDIDTDSDAEKKVIEFNKGKRRIPLVDIGGEQLSVPSRGDLEQRLR
jgi:mycoredoxin